MVIDMNITEKLRDWADEHIEDDDLYENCLDIADEIDERFFKVMDNVNVPKDMHGEPCFLDDVVWFNGSKMVVVAISHKDKVNIRDFGTKNAAFWVKSSHVMHEPDSQEKIYEDMENVAVKYAHMQLADAYCIELEIKKLLNRQKILDGKKA